jgi:hypothetical protein
MRGFPKTLAERGQRTQAIIDRFYEQPFNWRGAHCIKLAAAQGKAMGHKLPPLPTFRSALGAKRALSKRDAANVAELLDHYFVRLPAPAFALLGDLCVLPGEEGLDTVCIADGQGNLWGWHGSDPSKLSAIKFAGDSMIASWALGR